MSSQAADTQSRSQPPCEAYWCRLDQLDALLRDAGFSTSTDRWQNTHDLLLKLLEAGRLPEGRPGATTSPARPAILPFCPGAAAVYSAIRAVARVDSAAGPTGSAGATSTAAVG